MALQFMTVSDWCALPADQRPAMIYNSRRVTSAFREASGLYQIRNEHFGAGSKKPDTKLFFLEAEDQEYRVKAANGEYVARHRRPTRWTIDPDQIMVFPTFEQARLAADYWEEILLEHIQVEIVEKNHAAHPAAD